MTDQEVLLGAIDVGTTGARAVAVNLTGHIVFQVRHSYPTRTPHPGWAEQDPRDWSELAMASLAELSLAVGGLGRIRGLGLTGQCPTVAPFGQGIHPVGPGMLYRDNRAVAEATEMRDRIGSAAMHQRTGHVAEAFHVGPKILWLRRHAPEVFAQTTVFLQPRDVVLHRLTGVVATDETHANSTLFFDLRGRRWAPDLLQQFDLDPLLFPEVHPPWEVVAQLSPAVAADLHLQPGLPVVIGGADSQCVAFGAQVLDPGPISEMAGASSCLNSAVREPLQDIRVTHYSHVVAERYSTEVGLNVTGAAITWALGSLGYADYDALEAEAADFRRRLQQSRLASSDMLEAAPFFLPYLGDGERDAPSARGALVGLSARHDRSALAYSVLEGIAFGIADRVSVLVAAGSPADELRVSGGAARLNVLGQIKADALAVPVVHLDIDAAVVGAALLAAPAAGFATDVPIAQSSVLRRGRRITPSPWGRDLLRERAARFDLLRDSEDLRFQ